MLFNEERFRYAILTASDKGSRGEREDESAQVIQNIMNVGNCFQNAGYKIVSDDQEIIRQTLIYFSDVENVDLILTTGGTGLSMRDCTPEATLSIADRLVPGVPEAMRANGMQYTTRSMLSRAVSVMRKQTWIINLPGSPKAVTENLSFIFDDLVHGLQIIRGSAQECART